MSHTFKVNNIPVTCRRSVRQGEPCDACGKLPVIRVLDFKANHYFVRRGRGGAQITTLRQVPLWLDLCHECLARAPELVRAEIEALEDAA